MILTYNLVNVSESVPIHLTMLSKDKNILQRIRIVVICVVPHTIPHTPQANGENALLKSVNCATLRASSLTVIVCVN